VKDGWQKILVENRIDVRSIDGEERYRDNGAGKPADSSVK